MGSNCSLIACGQCGGIIEIAVAGGLGLLVFWFSRAVVAIHQFKGYFVHLCREPSPRSLNQIKSQGPAFTEMWPVVEPPVVTIDHTAEDDL